ncbi:hypothetical protein GCM10009827_061760 [Dactylosporangium maewongense]|uniref:Uncharacterized protein n=1 Tax=Dactylosporangium maewongense TaxID=634393 RepID=A0ABP4M0N3_9ACTN
MDPAAVPAELRGVSAGCTSDYPGREQPKMSPTIAAAAPAVAVHDRAQQHERAQPHGSMRPPVTTKRDDLRAGWRLPLVRYIDRQIQPAMLAVVLEGRDRRRAGRAQMGR